MNEKLNIQNLIELLAEKHGMDKADAESFVKEFFQLIEESLENDKYVKIRGLGTFKLIDVESRESVNINTGERFEIQGHTKVSFAPEPALKDLINKPFSHFETVVLNDETVLEDTQVALLMTGLCLTICLRISGLPILPSATASSPALPIPRNRLWIFMIICTGWGALME